jgi:hypothetical protein
MAKLKIPAGERITVKFKENFHLKNLYTRMHEWLVQEQWVTRSDKDFPEVFCGQNEAALGGTEIWWNWRPKKEKNSFIRWDLDINGHVILLRNVEVMKEGKKFKTNWGEVEIILTAIVNLDYNKRWQKHPILKNFLGLYVDIIKEKEFEKERDELRREMYRFQETIKEYLKMRKRLPEEESQGPFWPKEGIGEA